MASLDVDTVKMRECGQEIIDITRNLNEQFNGLFSRISNIPLNTHEWVGESANEFVKLSKIDKAQYINFNNELYKLGKMLIDYSYYIENDIERIRG